MSSYSASFQTGTLTEDGLDMWGIQRAEDGRYDHNSKIKMKSINRSFSVVFEWPLQAFKCLFWPKNLSSLDSTIQKKKQMIRAW